LIDKQAKRIEEKRREKKTQFKYRQIECPFSYSNNTSGQDE
jgi:hypothetical protein